MMSARCSRLLYLTVRLISLQYLAIEGLKKNSDSTHNNSPLSKRFYNSLAFGLDGDTSDADFDSLHALARLSEPCRVVF